MLTESSNAPETSGPDYEATLPARVAWVQLECPSCAMRDAIVLAHADHSDPLMRVVRPSAKFRATRFGSDLNGMMFGCTSCRIPAMVRSVRSESSTSIHALLAAHQVRQGR